MTSTLKPYDSTNYPSIEGDIRTEPLQRQPIPSHVQSRYSVVYERIVLLCGPLAALFFFIMLAGCHLMPPYPPTISAEEVVKHYKDHLTGTRVGIFFLILSSFLWPIYSFGVSQQLSRIPGVNSHLLSLQISGGCVAGAVFMLLGSFLAATSYRLDRDPAITQALGDLSLLMYSVLGAVWIPQQVAIQLIVVSDPRPDAIIPHWVSYFNFLMTATWIPAYASHMVYDGPLAWNGSVTFWLNWVSFCPEFLIVFFFVWRAAGRREIKGTSEGP